MGLLVVLALVAQCGAGYSAGYTTSYAYVAPTYYNAAVTYVPYVQAVKFVAVEPSYGDLYPSLVAGELRAARRYEAAERQAAAIERLETALERMAAPAPAPARAVERYQATYQAAAYAPPAPSGQDVAVPPPSYPAPQVPVKAPPPSYPAPQVPVKAPPPSYSAPQVPAKAPPSYSAPQVPAKAPPSYSAPQVPAKAVTDYGDVAPPAGPVLPEPTLGAGLDGLAVLGTRCASCHTRGATRGNKFAIFDAPGHLNPSLTSAQVAEMVARVEAGEMPPTSPLGADEVAAIRHYLTVAPSAMARR